MPVRTRRVYEPPGEDDGKRYLVDRLWPRGVSKTAARVDEWLKDLAPSVELRKWYGHEVDKYPEFRRHYREELRSRSEILARLREEAGHRTVTLLFGVKDAEHCNATVLKELLTD